MRRFTLLTFILFAFAGAFAQNISVADFYLAENDLTARTHGTSEEDQNGNICALIKVKTTEKGTWTFDVGMLGVTKTEMQNAAHAAEIWVYVPFGVTWMSIQHEKLGELDHYRFPCSIDKGCTYVMKLTTGKVITIVEEEVRQQYLLFQLDPPNAILEVNDKLWSVEADGTAMQYVDFGTYKYRVRASDYAEEVGKVTVDDPNNTKIVPVKLKSNLAVVTLKVDADAEIWVNNQKKGVRTWTGKLGSGTYKIECKQDGHETTMVSKEITTEMNGETITLPAPTPIYGSLMVESTPNLCQLYIDGKDYGTTPKSINNILVGQHEIRLTKDGYDEHKETITIAKGERKQVKATMNKQEVVQPHIATTTSSSEEQTFTVDGVSFTMKFVEGGTFQMGSDDGDAYDNEKPVHNVTVSSFMMGETEVTQALWKAVMGGNPSNFEGDNLPVENVSWNDCQEFIRRLNQNTGKNFRLPTEAEWEYAARGGKKNTGYKYSGSNSIGSVAVYEENSYNLSSNSPDFGIHKVKSKSANELGLYDMSGNVYEWCQDWFGSYNSGFQTNPQGPSSGSLRVLRGGCWFFEARDCRVSGRSYYGPEYGDSSGFRLCLPQ
jgi:formylglycine-generating enzyme required for sulfatase activity